MVWDELEDADAWGKGLVCRDGVIMISSGSQVPKDAGLPGSSAGLCVMPEGNGGTSIPKNIEYEGCEPALPALPVVIGSSSTSKLMFM